MQNLSILFQISIVIYIIVTSLDLSWPLISVHLVSVRCLCWILSQPLSNLFQVSTIICIIMTLRDLSWPLMTSCFSAFGVRKLLEVNLKGVKEAIEKNPGSDNKGIKAHFRIDESGIFHLDTVSYHRGFPLRSCISTVARKTILSITVKPLWKDGPRELLKLVYIDRWSLYTSLLTFFSPSIY